jgi:phospholipid transport system substrate-binding protein
MTISVIATTAFLTVAPGLAGYAWAQPGPAAATFVKSTSDQLVAIVNSAASTHEKRHQLQEVIDTVVDVDDIAHFCLGRFWPIATPDQQTQYMTLFHELLVSKIASHLGEYQGVRVTMGLARTSADTEIVITTLTRPQNPTIQVDWVVSVATGSPKIVDLLAEGTSLRLTQSADFASYLARHKYNIQQLIEAMRHLVAQNRK